MPPGTFSALLTLIGFAVCMAGGAWKAGAFNMMPRDDGIATAGIVSASILFAQDFKEWTALALSAPILAFTGYALLHNHHAPFAPFGAVIAFAGAVGLIARRVRAHGSQA